jgi:multidrug resistance efflux pump
MARDNSQETRRRQQALDRVEERIRTQEEAIRRLNRDLEKAGRSGSFERTHDLSHQIAQAQASLDQLMYEWEKLAQ